jgi:hypothetical protein
MHASPHQIQVQLPHNIESEQALLGASLCRSIPHATARTWRAIIEAYPGAVLLGLTATPSHRAEQDPHPCRASTTSSRAFICLVQRPTTAGHGGLDKAFLGLVQRDLSSGRNE